MNGGYQTEPINPAILRTPASVPFFKFNTGVIADGRRIRWSPEVVYFIGGLGLSAQYIRMDQRMRPAATGAARGSALTCRSTGTTCRRRTC